MERYREEGRAIVSCIFHEIQQFAIITVRFSRECWRLIFRNVFSRNVFEALMQRFIRRNLNLRQNVAGDVPSSRGTEADDITRTTEDTDQLMLYSINKTASYHDKNSAKITEVCDTAEQNFGHSDINVNVKGNAATSTGFSIEAGDKSSDEQQAGDTFADKVSIGDELVGDQPAELTQSGDYTSDAVVNDEPVEIATCDEVTNGDEIANSESVKSDDSFSDNNVSEEPVDFTQSGNLAGDRSYDEIANSDEVTDCDEIVNSEPVELTQSGNNTSDEIATGNEVKTGDEIVYGEPIELTQSGDINSNEIVNDDPIDLAQSGDKTSDEIATGDEVNNGDEVANGESVLSGDSSFNEIPSGHYDEMANGDVCPSVANSSDKKEPCCAEITDNGDTDNMKICDDVSDVKTHSDVELASSSNNDESQSCGTESEDTFSEPDVAKSDNDMASARAIDYGCPILNALAADNNFGYTGDWGDCEPENEPHIDPEYVHEEYDCPILRAMASDPNFGYEGEWGDCEWDKEPQTGPGWHFEYTPQRPRHYRAARWPLEVIQEDRWEM